MPDTAARQRYEDACRRIDWAVQELLAATDEKARAQLDMIGQASPPAQRQSGGLPRMRTVAECVQELKDQDPGARITAYTIKRMVNRGDIPTVKNGRITLVNFDSLCDCLQNPPTPHDPIAAPAAATAEKTHAVRSHTGGIRAVPE